MNREITLDEIKEFAYCKIPWKSKGFLCKYAYDINACSPDLQCCSPLKFSMRELKILAYLASVRYDCAHRTTKSMWERGIEPTYLRRWVENCLSCCITIV